MDKPYNFQTLLLMNMVKYENEMKKKKAHPEEVPNSSLPEHIQKLIKKPYFTKYLPVEGEIKEGDYIQVPHSLGAIGKVTEIKQGKEQPIYHYGNGNFTVASLCHKVKLFLCSRDIEVGDTVREMRSDVISREFEWTLMMDSCLHADDIFKVIGEVSPNAKWVTEGMEFDEDEIEVGYFMGELWCQAANGDSMKMKEHYKIKIKCPNCQNFH